MNEKTEQLRDLFVDLTDESTITEEQEEVRGSLGAEGDTDERLQSIIAKMRERYSFTTTLSDEELVTVVRGYYADDSDAEIARALDDAALSKTVARARVDLHLLHESDLDAPFDLADLRHLLSRDVTLADCAAELGVSESTVRRYKRIVEARDEARRVNHRYRDEFENILHDRELSDQLTRDMREDGLDDATDGMETNVSF